jgi:RNA polymerase sigma-70 factor (ECF subfamily)
MLSVAKSPWTADAFRQHERHVWGLAYRMTGSAADADDVVQETFARALEHPPARLDEPVRPWLTHVALNVARDTLRRRKRRRYVGPWLPSPSETGSESNVKTTHHRARQAMRAYDRVRRPPTPALREETREALQRFLAALVSEDAAALEASLSEGARAISDGGGEYVAALRPVLGRDRVARFLLGLQKKGRWRGRVALRMLNGLPAVLAEFDEPGARWAPRIVLRCELDERGTIREVHLVVASKKLAALA